MLFFFTSGAFIATTTVMSSTVDLRPTRIGVRLMPTRLTVRLRG